MGDKVLGDRFSGLAWMGVSYYRGFSPRWAIGLEGAWRGDRFSGLAWGVSYYSYYRGISPGWAIGLEGLPGWALV